MVGSKGGCGILGGAGLRPMIGGVGVAVTGSVEGEGRSCGVKGGLGGWDIGVGVGDVSCGG